MMALTSPEFMKATLGAISQLSQTRRGQEVAEGLLRGYASIVSPYNIFGAMMENLKRGKYYETKGNVEQQELRIKSIENLAQLVARYGGGIATAMGNVLKDLGLVDDETLNKLGKYKGLDEMALQLEMDKFKLNEYEVKERLKIEREKLKLLQEELGEKVELIKTQRTALLEDLKYLTPDKISKLIETKSNIMNLLLLPDAYKEKNLISDKEAEAFKKEVMNMLQLFNEYERAVLDYAMGKLKSVKTESDKTEETKTQETKKTTTKTNKR
jgi:hypothetical protein